MYKKEHQDVWYQINIIRYTIQYIFIICSFVTRNIVAFFYKSSSNLKGLTKTLKIDLFRNMGVYDFTVIFCKPARHHFYRVYCCETHCQRLGSLPLRLSWSI